MNPKVEPTLMSQPTWAGLIRESKGQPYQRAVTTYEWAILLGDLFMVARPSFETIQEANRTGVFTYWAANGNPVRIVRETP